MSDLLLIVSLTRDPWNVINSCLNLCIFKFLIWLILLHLIPSYNFQVTISGGSLWACFLSPSSRIVEKELHPSNFTKSTTPLPLSFLVNHWFLLLWDPKEVFFHLSQLLSFRSIIQVKIISRSKCLDRVVFFQSLSK